MPRSSERALLNFPEGAIFNRAGMNGILYRGHGGCHHNDVTLWCRPTTTGQMVVGLKRDPPCPRLSELAEDAAPFRSGELYLLREIAEDESVIKLQGNRELNAEEKGN